VEWAITTKAMSSRTWANRADQPAVSGIDLARARYGAHRPEPAVIEARRIKIPPPSGMGDTSVPRLAGRSHGATVRARDRLLGVGPCRVKLAQARAVEKNDLLGMLNSPKSTKPERLAPWPPNPILETDAIRSYLPQALAIGLPP
jgi:hypothetical protein